MGSTSQTAGVDVLYECGASPTPLAGRVREDRPRSFGCPPAECFDVSTEELAVCFRGNAASGDDAVAGVPQFVAVGGVLDEVLRRGA